MRDYFGEAGDEVPALPEDYRRQAVKKKAEGFTALKFDLDVPGMHGVDVHNRVLSNRATDYMVTPVPERPGLGITLNEDVARKYARKSEPFFCMSS